MKILLPTRKAGNIMLYDVVIIGGGVVGSQIAYALSRYRLRIALVEMHEDCCMGTSKANSAIVHAGFDAEEGTLKAQLNVRGCSMMEDICRDLCVPYKRNGSIVCAFSEEEEHELDVLMERGIANGVKDLRILRGEELFELEPHLSREVTAALYAPSAGIVDPFQLTSGALEMAARNGCDVIFGFKADGIYSCHDNCVVTSGSRQVISRYVINAAGLFSDELMNMTGDRDFEIYPRRGEYMLMDKKVGHLASTTIFSVPSKKGKGILVSPTVDGNLILGPNANIVEKYDVSTTAQGLEEITTGSLRLIPQINMRDVITSFAGVRSTPSTHDFVIRPSVKIPNVLHLAGIESPGLASSPAIAEYAVHKVREMGLELPENEAFVKQRIKAKPFREMSDEEKAEAIKENPRYGRVICRCEVITEAEIVDAVHRPVGATTLDGLKRRVRAGAGRCQGGFCMPRSAEILARELDIELREVSKKGGRSQILTAKTK